MRIDRIALAFVAVLQPIALGIGCYLLGETWLQVIGLFLIGWSIMPHVKG